jgi:hypothetical protein
VARRRRDAGLGRGVEELRRGAEHIHAEALRKFDQDCRRTQDTFGVTSHSQRNDVALCLFLLGADYETAEKYVEARRAYSRALDIRPDFSSASERSDLVDAIAMSLNLSME